MLRGLAIFLLLVAYPVSAQIGPGTLGFSGALIANVNTVFTHVQIGGAGAVQGTAATTAGTTMIARTDQFGCYISSKSGGVWPQWSQLITAAAMPALSVTDSTGAPLGRGVTGNGAGCDEAVPDPTNSSDLWVGWNGSVYFSSNKGSTFVLTCYPSQSTPQAQEAPIKAMGRTIAVDPNNSSVAYMSTPGSGLEFTKDQGATCSVVSSVGTATTTGGVGGGHLIAFDTSAGTTTVSGQTRTKNVYVSTYGTGVYKSTDGGVTWTLTTGTPTTHWYMTVDSNGVVWFIDNSGSGFGTARTYSGSWSAVSALNGKAAEAVAYDPNNCGVGACHVFYQITGGNGGGAYSANSGSTWNVATGSITVAATDVPWIANQLAAVGFFGAGAAFDDSGHVYVGDEGVFFTTPPTSGAAITYTSQTAGIEEAENNVVVNAPSAGGVLNVALWDVGCFNLTAPFSAFPTHGSQGCVTPDQSTLQHAYYIDWAAPAPATMVVLEDNQQGYPGGTYHSYSGISTDGGATWTAFAAVPSTISSGGLVGGCMAAASTTNFLWAPTDGVGGSVLPFYTSNGGASWSQISVSGVTQGFPFAYSFANHVCAADRVSANTFYIYNWNTGSGGDAIIKCTSGGASCAIASRPGLGPNEQFNPTIKTVPGQAGYLFLAYGTIEPPGDTTGNGFYYYTDAGVTKNTISGMQGVMAFGFGAAFAGHTFPAIYAAGWYNHVYGIWRSIDWDGSKTWQQVGTYPRNVPIPIEDIDGNKVTPGVFYLGTVSGVFCGALSSSNCNGGT